MISSSSQLVARDLELERLIALLTTGWNDTKITVKLFLVVCEDRYKENGDVHATYHFIESMS
jgi:hypothetical protein